MGKRKHDVARPYKPDIGSAETLADVLDVSLCTAESYVRTGVLPQPMIGNLPRWDLARVKAFIRVHNDWAAKNATLEEDEYLRGFAVVRPRKARIALPPGINAVRARGKTYYYFHPVRGTERGGHAVRIPGEPFNADGSLNAIWWDYYQQIAGQEPKPSKAGTFTSAHSQPTQKEWARHLRFIVASWGELRVGGVQPKHVLALRDARAKTPADANNRL